MDERRDGRELVDFDSDYSPGNAINKLVAEQRGLKYDSEKGVYLDSDGYRVRDKFGQPL